MTDVWRFILERLEDGEPVTLLYVTGSAGSSPGRQGFIMAVGRKGSLAGSIGGGIMEQRLVESVRRAWPSTPFRKRQIHRAGEGESRSGLICSGEQAVAIVPLGPDAIPDLQAIVRGEEGTLTLSESGLRFSTEDPDEGDAWARESIGTPDTLCIIGGGHVGLALSRTMKPLGFRVEVFDEREGLNTVSGNAHADRIHIAPFRELRERLPKHESLYVAVVTFGFEVDRVVMRQLLLAPGRTYRYLGLMGSRAKLGKLFDALRTERITAEALAKVHAPIGLPIQSRTPEEIAISIAAEIIQVKNSGVVSPPDPSNVDGVPLT